MLLDTHRVIGWIMVVFLFGELIPMYILVSLGPLLAECLNYSLRHIFSSSLCQLAVNQSITSSFMWNQLKYWSIKCFIIRRVFMLFASVPWVSVWCCFLHVFLLVESLGDSPIDLGLKLST